MNDSLYNINAFTWRKKLVRSSFMNHSKYFLTKKIHGKAGRTLDQIIGVQLSNKQNVRDIESQKARTRAFVKIETKIQKNTKRAGTANKILLKKSQKEDKVWNLRDSINFTDRSKPKTTSNFNKTLNTETFQFQLKQHKHSSKQNFKRIADYKIAALQQKCPFTRYQIYTLFSTFNAIISDSINFKGTKLSFNVHRFINDVSTMLKAESDLVKRVFLTQTRKKYYAVNKSFQFLDFLTFVDQVRKQNLRQKVNDFLNLLFDMQKQSLNFLDLIALFRSKNNEKQCQQYISKLFVILMKAKTDSVTKQQLKQLFEANQDMLQMFRKIVPF